MKGHEFKRWRKSLELSQKEAAEALGLKRRVVQYYEKGKRDGDPVKIPRFVSLACYAITQGIKDYRGPDAERRRKKRSPVMSEGLREAT
jgi:predicted transcriptional regulator